ncbi:crotonase [Halioglobus maricola]|uniref:Crotonase n=1 Tax=Halioglobus maricola TaxID=2601894 RepID=A0A5P9NLN0_9GAMM|nr:enoyl-CoA hydratase-related protein [Halioglobus maricola]QFU76740.1 crotonase [Halioglobus maricola]
MNDELLLQINDGIGLITLNRPEAHNTLTSGVIEGLGAAYKQCDEDDAVRVVVVTGAGRSFCAGADMSGGGATFDSDSVAVEVDSCPLSTQAWDVRKPVIAACNGHAVGAGLGMAMQADMRVFADEAKYGFLQARRGVVTDFAMEYVLPRVIGMERALELLMRGQRLSGQEAVAWGLAGRSVPAEQVLDTAMDIARDIAVNSAPLAMAFHKRLLWKGMDMDLGEFAGLESRALNLSMTKPDAIEGGMAYFERRPPEWTGSVSTEWPDWMED